MTVELQRTYSDLKRSKTNVRAGSIPLIPSHTFCDVTTVRRYLKTSSVAYVLRYYTFQGPIWLSHLLSSVSSCTEIGFTDDQFTSLIIIKKSDLADCDTFCFCILLLRKKASASEFRGSGSITGQSLWDLWWMKCHCYKPLSEYFGFLLSVASHQWSMFIINSTVIGAVWSSVVTWIKKDDEGQYIPVTVLTVCHPTLCPPPHCNITPAEINFLKTVFFSVSLDCLNESSHRREKS